jgi:hypothetical protein
MSQSMASPVLVGDQLQGQLERLSAQAGITQWDLGR